MPVFPLVGSIRVSPGLMRPFFWASSTMRLPMRSFTEPPAFRYSHLARYSQPVLRPTFLRRTIGVLPIESRIEAWIWVTAGLRYGVVERTSAQSLACAERSGNHGRPRPRVARGRASRRSSHLGQSRASGRSRPMPQETLVVQLSPAEQTRLAAALDGPDFEPRALDHARFSVKGQGVVATLYRSGKLVVQGSEVQMFAERYLGGRAAPRDVDLPIEVGERTLIGSDEAGKGDYFGPLVVVALRADAKERAELVQAGVADSKTLSDERIAILAPAL